MTPEQTAALKKLQELLPQLAALAELLPWIRERKEQLIGSPLDPGSRAVIVEIVNAL